MQVSDIQMLLAEAVWYNGAIDSDAGPKTWAAVEKAENTHPTAMIAVILRYGWRLLSSRIGLAVVLCALLWGWHIHDKRQAISTAREGFVREFELTAAQAELDAIRRRMVAADKANQSLREKVQEAEGEALRFAAELEAYERETRINPEGVVDSALLGRLRAN